MSEFSNLPESTVRFFKKAYREELEKKRKKCDPQPVVEITAKPKGHPLILLELLKKADKVSESDKSERWCGEYSLFPSCNRCTHS